MDGFVKRHPHYHQRGKQKCAAEEEIPAIQRDGLLLCGGGGEGCQQTDRDDQHGGGDAEKGLHRIADQSSGEEGNAAECTADVSEQKAAPADKTQQSAAKQMLQVFVVGGIKGIAVQCDQHLCVIGVSRASTPSAPTPTSFCSSGSFA